MSVLTADNIRSFCQKHGIGIAREAPFKDGTQLILDHCVFDETHTNGDAKILIYNKGGSVGYQCHHNSCAKKTIADFARKFEPDFFKDSKGISASGKAAVHYSTDLKAASDFEEKPAEWLIPGYIPKYAITTLSGDGGTGKSTVICDICSWITARNQPFLISLIDFQIIVAQPDRPEPGKVFYFAAEDSFTHTVRRRLRKAGADLSKVLTMDISDERFHEIKFNSPFLEQLIDVHRPELIIFDPLQSFIPPEVNMGSRNEMRDMFSYLMSLTERYRTTVLIISHTNKRPGASGRDRIADSADLWDASRSVLMIGNTKERAIRYLSQEKSNYGQMEQTILFSIVDEHIEVESYCDKKDYDFQNEKRSKGKPSIVLEEAKEIVLETLQNADEGEMLVKDLDEIVSSAGISAASLKRAKKELRDKNQISYISRGNGRGDQAKQFFVKLGNSEPTVTD